MKKNVMKKFITMLLAILLVLSQTTQSYAAECSVHDYQFLYSTTLITQTASTMHVRKPADVYRCRTCGQYLYIINGNEPSIEPHTSHKVDLGHLAGSKHQYQDKCSLCGYVLRSYTITCSGSPCATPTMVSLD